MIKKITAKNSIFYCQGVSASIHRSGICFFQHRDFLFNGLDNTLVYILDVPAHIGFSRLKIMV